MGGAAIGEYVIGVAMNVLRQTVHRKDRATELTVKRLPLLQAGGRGTDALINESSGVGALLLPCQPSGAAVGAETHKSHKARLARGMWLSS